MSTSPKVKSGRMGVLGSLAFDRLERGAIVQNRIGGALTYSGLTAAKLGWDVHLLARVPDSSWSELSPLAAHCHTQWLPSKKKTCFVNRERPDSQREQLLTSTSDPLSASDLAKWHAISQQQPLLDWIHLGPLFPDDFSADFVPAVRPHARVLSADLQGWMRAVNGVKVVPAFSNKIIHDLHDVDWLKASLEEWHVFSQATAFSPAQAVSEFSLKGLLISAGDRGGKIILEGHEMNWAAEIPSQVRVETGAGDVFMAAFMSEMLQHQQHSFEHIEACLLRAAHIASLHVSGTWLDEKMLQLDSGN